MVLTIFESRARRTWIGQGGLISLSVHALLISGAVAATRPPAPDEPKEVSESVRFLMPVGFAISIAVSIVVLLLFLFLRKAMAGSGQPT